MKNFGKFLCLSVLITPPIFALGDPRELCRNAAPTLDCDSFSSDDHKSLKNLFKDTSISQVCGNHICDGAKTDKNCPSDCKEGRNYTFSVDRKSSYNARTTCNHVKEVHEPRNIEEVQSIVLSARARNLPIKPVGASHTDNGAICTNGAIITSKFLNNIIGLETYDGVETVRVQSGVTISQLGKWLHERRKSLGYSVVGYDKVQIAGVIGTGAHGSSFKSTSVLSDRVVSMRMVLSDGKIREFSRKTTGKTDPKLWSALRVNLGSFGFVYDVRLAVEDDFQIKVTTTKHSDSGLYTGNGLMDYVKNCDVPHVHWFPERKGFTPKSLVFSSSAHKGEVIVHCGKSIHKSAKESWEDFSAKVDDSAQYALHAPELSNFSYHIFKDILHKAAFKPKKYACYVEDIRRKNLVKTPHYLKRSSYSGALVSDPTGIRGWSFKMQNSRGSDEGDSFRQTDWEVAVPGSKAVEAFKILRDLFADTPAKDGVCLPLIGVFVRFGVVNDTFLSHAGQGGDFKLGEPVMFIEVPEYLPSLNAKTIKDDTFAQAVMAEYERPLKEFVETMVTKLGARVHWAKNRPELFETQKSQGKEATRMEMFDEQVRKLDPIGSFSNDFLKAVGAHTLTEVK